MQNHRFVKALFDLVSVFSCSALLVGGSYLLNNPELGEHISLTLSLGFVSVPMIVASLFWLTLRVTVAFNIKSPEIGPYGFIQYSPKSATTTALIVFGGGAAVAVVMHLLKAIWTS
jgi:hypothetical protein